MELGVTPDFERMYVIKIRGSEQEIMDELARFGHPDARFLDLRFVEVRRIQGESNEVGSVIRYRVPLAGFGAELRLTKRVGLETLLYQLDGRLADHGKLILQCRTDQGRKPQAVHLRLIRLQKRPRLC